MGEERRDRIVAALVGDDSPLRHEAAELIVEHLLATPVGELLDAASLSPLVVAALDHDNVARAVERHVLPGIERVRDRIDDAGDRVGDALPPQVQARIVELAANPRGPRFRWMRGALDAGKLRDLFAPVVQDTLMQFVRTIPGVGGGGGAAGAAGAGEAGRGARGGGLVGRLGREASRGAGRLVSMGRSVADGLGVDLEKRVQETAREFSQGAMAGAQRGLRERLESPQGREIIVGLSKNVCEHIFATPIETIMKDLDRLPLSAAVQLAPATIAHVLAREVGRGALEGEIAAWFEVEGARSVGELLDEAGMLEGVRALAIERAERSCAGFFASEPFADWLARVLAASE